MANIFIIDDDPNILNLVSKITTNMGHKAHPYATGHSGLKALSESNPDLLIVDLRIDDMNGLQIIEQCKKTHPNLPMIMVTGFGSIETAIKAMKLGAFDYITKPFEVEDLQRAINRAIVSGKAKTGQKTEHTEHFSAGAFKTEFVGSSEKVAEILKLVEKISEDDGHVLIQGEIGSGKQTLARTIHNKSKRKNLPFKILPCSSLPEDLLEKELFGGKNHPSIFKRAEGGTVLIDEIDLLPLRLQSLLDSFLESINYQRLQKTISENMQFRFISTSSVPLEDVVNAGKFREDFYYRISIIPIDMPPLRRRSEDIMPLANYFLKNHAKTTSTDVKFIDKFTEQMLQKYNWPGNVDELQNAIQHACVLAEDDRIRPSHLPAKVTQKIEVSDDENDKLKTLLPIGTKLKDFIDKQEKVFIFETLKYNEGNREKTAMMLGVSIATLYRKMGLKLERDKIINA